MKKLLLFLLSFILICFVGCAPASPQKPGGSLEPSPDPSPWPNLQWEHAVHEFGEAQAIINDSQDFSCFLLYPVSGHALPDQTLKGWAENLFSQIKAERVELLKKNPSLNMELNVQFNSYLVGDRFVGIEEIGFYSHTSLAHPADIVQTFNFDLNTGVQLTPEQLFPQEKRAEILALVREKLISRDPDLSEYLEQNINESWLLKPVLKAEGVSFLLERGGYLPSYLGTQKVFLTYEELKDTIVFPGEPSAEIPSKEPTPEITPTESPAATVTPPESPDPRRPVIALTFDDGPSPHTIKILNLLEQYESRGTFFMVGNRLHTYSDIVRKVEAQGSEVASHTWSHKKLTSLTREEVEAELKQTNDAVYSITGKRPSLLRPPYGLFNDQLKSVTKDLGMAIVNWSVDTEDWKTRNAKETYNRIMAEVKDGSIILCHDLHAETAQAMELVIPELVRQGYQLVTVSELLQSKAGIEPGTMYRHG